MADEQPAAIDVVADRLAVSWAQSVGRRNGSAHWRETAADVLTALATDGFIVARMTPRPDVFVHRGPDRTIAGVPFDVTYRDGDPYVMTGGPAQPTDGRLWEETR